MTNTINGDQLKKLFTTDAFREFISNLDEKEFNAIAKAFEDHGAPSNVANTIMSLIFASGAPTISLPIHLKEIVSSCYAVGFKAGLLYQGALQEEELFKMYNNSGDENV